MHPDTHAATCRSAVGFASREVVAARYSGIPVAPCIHLGRAVRAAPVLPGSRLDRPVIASRERYCSTRISPGPEVPSSTRQFAVRGRRRVHRNRVIQVGPRDGPRGRQPRAGRAGRAAGPGPMVPPSARPCPAPGERLATKGLTLAEEAPTLLSWSVRDRTMARFLVPRNALSTSTVDSMGDARGRWGPSGRPPPGRLPPTDSEDRQ
jgi:hypothetical protein